MADSEPAPESAASGVQNLIDRIRDDGVSAGRTEAARVIRSAERKAEHLIAEAKAQAERTLESARAQIASERNAAEESLKLAARDTIQDLGSKVRTAFENQLKRFVSEQLDDRDFLREVILALASETAEKTIHDRAVEILLSENVGGGDTEADSGDEAAEERIRQLVLAVSGRTLREGIEFRLDPHVKNGASVKIIDEELRIDLNEDTICEFLIRHLLPRYRRILGGVDSAS